MNNITKSVIASVLTAAFVGPVTWGFSQQVIAERYSTSLHSVATQVNVVEREVARHEMQINENKTALERTDKVYESRITNIIKLWEQQLVTERELISLVREQNRLMEFKRGNP